MKRKIYLDMHSLEDAQNIFHNTFANYSIGAESINARNSYDRITAEPVIANFSSPAFHGAAMDGFAVIAEETFTASDDFPLTLDIQNSQAIPINTGYPLPADKNAVIMVEHVILSENHSQATIRAPVFPWQNVRKAGEDIIATELLFPTNHRISPPDIGALLTAGCPEVKVWKKPHVTIIPTGSELVHISPTNHQLEQGKTVESNSAVLAAMAQKSGAETLISPIISDDYNTIKDNLLKAVHSKTDIVIINAGSSAGSADYTASVIKELGEVLVHGVTIMPGKPTILGIIDQKPVVGNPGYPVSAIISFENFVIPFLKRIQGVPNNRVQTTTAILAKNIPSRGGIEEFRRMITGKIGNQLITVPVKKGAGAITTMTRANSMLRIPASSEGIVKHSQVSLELLRPLPHVERTLICTGSHDLCLDVIRDFLNTSTPSFPLASTHVGSLGGIMAIKEKMTHIAGSHLLDPQTGEYNISYIKRFLKDTDVTLITLTHRQQGFMVLPGNPKNIKSTKDLTKDNVTFINRQAGSGTRVLFDYELDKVNLDSDEINGYENEEYTHMAVAVSVLSGKADAGLGIMAAAKALKLDFIPLTEERYDLVIPSSFLQLDNIRQMLDIINKKEFKEKIAAMGGYSVRETGNQIIV